MGLLHTRLLTVGQTWLPTDGSPHVPLGPGRSRPEGPKGIGPPNPQCSSVPENRRPTLGEQREPPPACISRACRVPRPATAGACVPWPHRASLLVLCRVGGQDRPPEASTLHLKPQQTAGHGLPEALRWGPLRSAEVTGGGRRAGCWSEPEEGTLLRPQGSCLSSPGEAPTPS